MHLRNHENFLKMKHENFTLGGFCPGGFCLGGFCPGGVCRGVYARGFVRGGFVLEPSKPSGLSILKIPICCKFLTSSVMTGLC